MTLNEPRKKNLKRNEKDMKIIMIVDDEHDFRDLVCLLMEKAGYKIMEAKNGKECIEMLKEGHIPDLILLDVMMPEMNGWETFDRIEDNAFWKMIPIVFLTVRKDDIARNTGTFLGDDYITKPFDVTDLKKRINNVLKISHSGLRG